MDEIDECIAREDDAYEGEHCPTEYERNRGEIAEALDERDAMRDHWYEDDDLIDGVGFADPGGNSSLRAATPDNPRDRPCPTCGTDNVLTRLDVRAGYQCNRCADRDERGGY